MIGSTVCRVCDGRLMAATLKGYLYDGVSTTDIIPAALIAAGLLVWIGALFFIYDSTVSGLFAVAGVR